MNANDARAMEAGQTISYEFSCLKDALNLARLTPQPPNTPIGNIAREAFLMHARIVADFLGGTPCNDDIQAKHFMPLAKFSATLTKFEAARKSINKALAHPSFMRGSINKNWDYEGLFAEIEQQFNAFLTALSGHDKAMRANFKV